MIPTNIVRYLIALIPISFIILLIPAASAEDLEDIFDDKLIEATSKINSLKSDEDKMRLRQGLAEATRLKDGNIKQAIDKLDNIIKEVDKIQNIVTEDKKPTLTKRQKTIVFIIIVLIIFGCLGAIILYYYKKETAEIKVFQEKLDAAKQDPRYQIQYPNTQLPQTPSTYPKRDYQQYYYEKSKH